MDSPPKLYYEIDLTRPLRSFTSEAAEVRPITANDLDGLADLMYDAYVGTIDYEDETRQDAAAEIASYFDGEPMVEHSFLANLDGRVASAVLVSLWRDSPFVGYVMTVPAHKNQGLGRLVVATAMANLRQSGHTRLQFFITQGNTPSEALFEALGAVHVPEA
jgi:RimJ/RimL family protein N-acetyltransferase